MSHFFPSLTNLTLHYRYQHFFTLYCILDKFCGRYYLKPNVASQINAWLHIGFHIQRAYSSWPNQDKLFKNVVNAWVNGKWQLNLGWNNNQCLKKPQIDWESDNRFFLLLQQHKICCMFWSNKPPLNHSL